MNMNGMNMNGINIITEPDDFCHTLMHHQALIETIQSYDENNDINYHKLSFRESSLILSNRKYLPVLSDFINLIKLNINHNIDLTNNDLNKIFNLENLKELKLHINFRYINNINNIYKLKNLESLTLSNNYGGYENDDNFILKNIHKLIKLKELDISGFNIRSLLPYITILRNLKNLNINYCAYDSLPDNFFKLDLESLNINARLSKHDLSNFHLIKEMKNLKHLSINYQNIKYLPPIKAYITAYHVPLECICGLDINIDYEYYNINDNNVWIYKLYKQYNKSTVCGIYDISTWCKKICKFRCGYMAGKFL